MKKIFALTLTALLLALLAAPAAMADDELPMTLAGITLGDDVKNYAKSCDIRLVGASTDAPFLDVVTLTPDFVPGVRGGSLAYANCEDSGRVVRIKLKFHDRSQTLFNNLLDKYKAAFGKPNSYQGDAFKNIIAWQWDFTKGDERVSVLLMWSRMKEMRPGVSVKMTLESLLDKEYECFKAKEQLASKGGPSKVESLSDFVPE